MEQAQPPQGQAPWWAGRDAQSQRVDKPRAADPASRAAPSHNAPHLGVLPRAQRGQEEAVDDVQALDQAALAQRVHAVLLQVLGAVVPAGMQPPRCTHVT